ncbi:hypothetical protein [Chloroflexus sp. Y-396-1]|uniref:hypothetical protein n=1 Tax=Chloroflexus sp. Y-396-1 TaxID=867845 RepID=UPI00048B138C|nr:hypothetical protein [Chloroflexus sp. Y-396-1]
MSNNNEEHRHPTSDRPETPDLTDPMFQSIRAWNELLAASTDMAFDLVLKNWDYSRSLRHSTEQAVADAIRTQQRLSQEMLQAWQGYVGDIQSIIRRMRK